MINLKSKYTIGVILIIVLAVSSFMTKDLLDSDETSIIELKVQETSTVTESLETVITSPISETLELCKTHPEVLKYVIANNGKKPQLRAGTDPDLVGELNSCIVSYFDEGTQEEIKVVFPFTVVK